LVIGCLPFISFALLLYPPRSPTGAAPSGTASFIAVRSHSGEEGGEKCVGGWGDAGGGEAGRRCAAERSQWRQWEEAGMLDCQISAVEYLMEPGVFI